jgi:hypothetical protein
MLENNIDPTLLWEGEFIEGLTGSIKFPVSLHDVKDLTSVENIEEMVEYEQPRKKLNQVKIVEVGKKKIKKEKGGLF